LDGAARERTNSGYTRLARVTAMFTTCNAAVYAYAPTITALLPASNIASV